MAGFFFFEAAMTERRSCNLWYPRYSGTPLIRPPTGHEKLAVLTGWPYKRGRVKFHDWSTSSDVLTDAYHNCISKHSHIKMLTNLLDLENNLYVRDVHKKEKSSKRSKEQEKVARKKQAVLKTFYLFSFYYTLSNFAKQAF